MLKMFAKIGFSLVVCALAGCAANVIPPDTGSGRWIQFHADTQSYSIAAQNVSRGALLDELAHVAGADVRPQSERDGLVSAKADGLDLETLVSLILPAGAHPTIRAGQRDVAAIHTGGARKEGPALIATAGLIDKPEAKVDYVSKPAMGEKLKGAVELEYVPRKVEGPHTKPEAQALLRVSDTVMPKKAVATDLERATVRLTLQFEEGTAPRLITAQTLEGRAPVQRYVTGTFLFALLDTNGRVLQAGTFQDPLNQRSYQQDGPHANQRAKSGVVGISVWREFLGSAQLQVVDMTGIALPRELTDEVVRSALDRGRTSLRIDSKNILSRLDQESKQ